MATLKEIAEKLKTKTKIAIFAHVRPDGDTLGSSFALKYALIALNKTAEVICQDEVPEKFFYIDECFKTAKSELDNSYDCYIAIDTSDEKRLGIFADQFMKAKNSLCVDHHVSNNNFADFTYFKDTAATAESIFALIKLLGVAFDKRIANCLLLGIVTDTGAFAHKNVTGECLTTAAELVNAGADLNAIIYYMFKMQSKERAKLFAVTMEKIRYFLDGTLGIITVTKDNIAKCGASQDMTEGFIDFVMSVDNVKVGICLLETNDKSYKVSFRSKGADVNLMAQVYGGGGHVLASGCMVNGYLEDVIDRLVYTVKQYT